MASNENPTKINRDKEEEGRGDSKRQKLMNRFSPPPPATIADALLPLASYDDDDDDDDEQEDHDMMEKRNGNGLSKKEEDYDDDEEESFGQGSIHGMRQRQVEIRRDCPYLDTVNRQVIPSYVFFPLEFGGFDLTIRVQSYMEFGIGFFQIYYATL